MNTISIPNPTRFEELAQLREAAEEADKLADLAQWSAEHYPSAGNDRLCELRESQAADAWATYYAARNGEVTR